MDYQVNGHAYHYDEFLHLLYQAGIPVARVELARDSDFDEYNYFIDKASGEVMNSEYAPQNESNFKIGLKLAQQYDGYDS